MKKNNKGFTLVELIVVLVILAILAAVLVPALLGYIDKAKKKKDMNAASSAYVAAQAVCSEYYAKGTRPTDKQLWEDIAELTDIDKTTFNVKVEEWRNNTDSTKKDYFIIKKFIFYTGEYDATTGTGTNKGSYTWENGTWDAK